MIIGDQDRGTDRIAMVENAAAKFTSGISGYENFF
jgi:hypothetical protein